MPSVSHSARQQPKYLTGLTGMLGQAKQLDLCTSPIGRASAYKKYCLTSQTEPILPGDPP